MVRIGVGGRAFGVRGGISSRGIGVGVGPVSAGAPWGGGRRRSSRRSRGSSGGEGIILVGFVLVLFAAISPYLLGTYVAVQLGAANPSTARSTTGWVLEFLTVVALISGIWVFSARSLTQTRERERQALALAEARAREEAREHAKLVASGLVYPERHANSTVYRHGVCTISHRTAETAERCRSRG